MRLHLISVMRQPFCYIFFFIFCAFISQQPLAQNSVQLPGGIQFYDDSYNTPYLFKANEDVALTIKKNVFVRVGISKKECFIGEPILVVYKLFTRLRSESRLLKQPEFSGCSVIEMTTNDLTAEMEIIDGKPYKSYIIRKVQLVPLQEGNLILGTVEVENTISFFKTMNEANNNVPVLTKTITLGNTPLVVKVKTLPTEKRPDNFKNTVGSFTISTKVNKITDTVNDNNNLEITIEGKGNFQNLVCPVINWPNDIEYFDSDNSESIDRLNFPVSGRKKFIIPFSCKREGKATIPAMAFSFFDGEVKQYKTVVTDSIDINVLPAAEKIDTFKLQAEVGNGKYIWIVLFIAVTVGFILWLSFFKKSSEKEAVFSAAIEEESEPIVAKTNAEKLNNLLLIEDDKLYYQEAQNLAIALLETEDDNLKKEALKKLIDTCNEALYAYNEISTKEILFQKLEEFIA